MRFTDGFEVSLFLYMTMENSPSFIQLVHRRYLSISLLKPACMNLPFKSGPLQEDITKAI